MASILAGLRRRPAALGTLNPAPGPRTPSENGGRLAFARGPSPPASPKPSSPAGTPVRGLRARDRHLSESQRAALHRLRHATTPLDAEAVRVLYAVAHPCGAFTEGDAPDPATVAALQQRGIIRRRPRAGYLELTDDARFSLMPE